MSLIHQFRAAATCLWITTLLAGASSDETESMRALSARGYLAVVGPAPLRFGAAPDHTRDFIKLPPPEPAQVDSVPASPSSEQTELTDPFTLPEMLEPAADKGSILMEAVSPPPVVEAPVVGQQPISPHVFLQYFSGATNAPAPNAAAPVDFTPPRGGVTRPTPLSHSP
jgi:hypothetical protein